MNSTKSFGDGKAPRSMIQRYKTIVAFGLLVTGLAFAFTGCSDSPPPTPVPQPVAPEQTEPLTAAEKKARQREFDNMGIKEKQEYRRKQRAAAAGQTP